MSLKKAIINNGNNSEITTVAQLEDNTQLIMAELGGKNKQSQGWLVLGCIWVASETLV